MGGRRPQIFFRTKVGHALKGDVIGFRQVARQVRRTTPPKISNPIFSNSDSPIFHKIFQHQRTPVPCRSKR